MVDPLSYFSLQPVLHNWINKDRDMYYSVCGMLHIRVAHEVISSLAIRMVHYHLSNAIQP